MRGFTQPLTQRLVPLLLNFRKGTNRDELDQFFETITDDPASVTPVSEAAFCRARKKLKPEALVTLNNVLLDSANQQIAQQRWRGLRVLAVDGSTGRLPDFPAIEEYFGKPSGSGVPLARFSRLFDVLNDQILHAVPRNSLTYQAMQYTLNQRDRLIGYLADGRLHISNALAENAIRPFAVGRRNWLFADTPRGARASATVYSLIETAKANGLEPFTYLHHVLQHIGAVSTVEDIKALLPWNVDLKGVQEG